MLKSHISDLNTIKAELNIPVSVCSVPYNHYCSIKSITTKDFANASSFMKNPAYKSINSSQMKLGHK